MLPAMPEQPLPVDAARGDARHRDVREAVFAVVPQRKASWTRRVFWRLVLTLARSRAGLTLLRRLRGS
jgi:hypothetical protein